VGRLSKHAEQVGKKQKDREQKGGGHQKEEAVHGVRSLVICTAAVFPSQSTLGPMLGTKRNEPISYLLNKPRRRSLDPLKVLFRFCAFGVGSLASWLRGSINIILAHSRLERGLPRCLALTYR
jgi:hypothetical protein